MQYLKMQKRFPLFFCIEKREGANCHLPCPEKVLMRSARIHLRGIKAFDNDFQLTLARIFYTAQIGRAR